MPQDVFRALGSRAVAIALMSLLLAGCGGGVERVTAPPTYGDQADLVARVSVTPVEFHPREKVQIEVGIRNPTQDPIMAAVYPPCISYVVRDASGTPVSPGMVCLAWIVPREIAPGESITVRFSWDGTTPSGTPLPAGEYDVGSAGLPVSAPPVTIRLLEP